MNEVTDKLANKYLAKYCEIRKKMKISFSIILQGNGYPSKEDGDILSKTNTKFPPELSYFDRFRGLTIGSTEIQAREEIIGYLRNVPQEIYVYIIKSLQ